MASVTVPCFQIISTIRLVTFLVPRCEEANQLIAKNEHAIDFAPREWSANEIERITNGWSPHPAVAGPIHLRNRAWNDIDFELPVTNRRARIFPQYGVMTRWQGDAKAALRIRGE